MITPFSRTVAPTTADVVPAIRHLSATSADVPETLTARPLTALFDAAFDLYRRHFVKIAILVAVAFVPLQIALHAIVNLGLRPWETRIDNLANAEEQTTQAFMLAFSYLGTGAPQYGIPGVFSVLVLLLISGAVAVGTASLLHGEPIRLHLAYRRMARVLFRLLGVGMAAMTGSVIIVLVVMFVLFFLLGVLMLAVGEVLPDAVGYGMTIGMVVCPYAVVAAFLARVFLLAVPLIVLEGRAVSEVPTRNGQLLRRMNFWKVWLATMGLPVVVLGLQYFVLFGTEMLLNALHPSPALFWVGENLLATLIYFFFQPYWMIFLTLLYFDGRIRRDGYDLYRMADALEKTDAREAVA